MKPRIIGLSGKRGSGKSTIAKILAKYGYKEISFAEPLKLALAHAVGCTYEDLDSPETKDSPLQIPLVLTRVHIMDALLYLDKEFLPIDAKIIRQASETASSQEFNSYRELMQYFGTEVVRDYVGQDYWIEILKSRVSEVDTQRFVVTDARFPDERALVKKLMGTTAVIIREQENEDAHRSENLLGSVGDYDLIFYNSGTILQLAEDIDLWFSLKGV